MACREGTAGYTAVGTARDYMAVGTAVGTAGYTAVGTARDYMAAGTAVGTDHMVAGTDRMVG